jgi:hypothetical protein
VFQAIWEQTPAIDEAQFIEGELRQ